MPQIHNLLSKWHISPKQCLIVINANHLCIQSFYSKLKRNAVYSHKFKKACPHIINCDKWKAINIHIRNSSSKKINLYWDSHKKIVLSWGKKRQIHYVNWCIFTKIKLLKAVRHFSSLCCCFSHSPVRLIKQTLLMSLIYFSRFLII